MLDQVYFIFTDGYSRNAQIYTANTKDEWLSLLKVHYNYAQNWSGKVKSVAIICTDDAP